MLIIILYKLDNLNRNTTGKKQFIILKKHLMLFFVNIKCTWIFLLKDFLVFNIYKMKKNLSNEIDYELSFLMIHISNSSLTKYLFSQIKKQVKNIMIFRSINSYSSNALSNFLVFNNNTQLINNTL